MTRDVRRTHVTGHSGGLILCVRDRRDVGGRTVPQQPTTRAQISGYNFLVRRMEHAIVRRDVRMLFDPMRSQSRAFTVGVVLATVALAGCAVLALIRPQDKVGKDSKIFVAKDSGGMYVKLGDTVHPVLNLASAELAVGEHVKPGIVKGSELAKRPRGALIGIPGAPSSMPTSSPNGRSWTVCDTVAAGSGEPTTSVVVGAPKFGDTVRKLSSADGLLVKSPEGSVYLVYDGKRARVDVGAKNRVVTDALQISGITPRPISEGMLNAIPEVRAIAAPKIDGAGAAPGFQMLSPDVSLPSDAKVGWVLVTPGETKQYYVVLRDGLQQVSPAAADMILYSLNIGQQEYEKVSPSVPSNSPESHELDSVVSTYPSRQLTISKVDDAPVSCLSWKPLGTSKDRETATTRAELSLVAGRSVPVDPNAKGVKLIKSDDASTIAGEGAAPRTKPADTVYIQPGTGDYVLTTGIEPNSQAKYNLFYVADTGVRYGIDNAGVQQGQADASKSLGLTDPAPAPDPIVALLGGGPTLSRKAALVAHEGMSGDPRGDAVPVPSAGG
ncbi:MAG: type VII secretion protein EccB [Mycobacteriaceae bacterium]|nr:type VII secretion protein EccB [Mycobacteriaceae bacterium]